MEQPLSIVLIEDDPSECEALAKYIDTISAVTLLGMTNHMNKALALVEETMPHAIILDLELHKGSGNGLSFLEALKEKHFDFPIYILVTTHNMSSITHESARDCGADFILLKSQEDYSAKTVIQFLISQKKMDISSSKDLYHTGIPKKTSTQHKSSCDAWSQSLNSSVSRRMHSGENICSMPY